MLSEPLWYCLRSQIKRERIAAAQVALLDDCQTFLPLVRYARNTPKGKRSKTEPMFPNYFFAKFAPNPNLRAVRYAMGVNYIVSNRDKPVPIADSIIEELRELTVEDVLEMTPDPLKVGDKVKIIRGIFAEQEGVIFELKPASERVVVLMELLGSPQAIAIPKDELHTTFINTLKQ